MRRQWIELPGVTALVIVAALMSPVQAQAPTPTSAADAETPRTPWGEPDLQGIWGTEVLAPLERPVEIGDREFLTDEEIAALESERSQDLGRDERSAPGTETDVAGAYNNVWQWNAYKSTSRRTSLNRGSSEWETTTSHRGGDPESGRSGVVQHWAYESS